MKFNKKKISGFTLIELLAVIAVVAILASILITLIGRVRQSANVAKCTSNMRQLGQGMLLYSNLNHGRFPDKYNRPAPGVTWFWDASILDVIDRSVDSDLLSYASVLAPYSDILHCPSDLEVRAPDKVNIPRSYTINPVLVNNNGDYTGYGATSVPEVGINVNSLVNPPEIAMLLEKHKALNTYNSGSHWVGVGDEAVHDDRLNVVFCDGSVRSVVAPSSRSEAIELYLQNL